MSVIEGKPQGKKHLISAMFLVAGTCIGGGMLALPVATGVSGFIPSSIMMAICWIAMTISALLLLEVSLWMKPGAHVITMSETLLGPVGRIVSWCVYLFISYASLVAYSAAGGNLIETGVSALGFYLSRELSCLLFILVFVAVIYLGTAVVGRVNAILFIAMIAAYVGMIATGATEVKTNLLQHRMWPTTILAIPLLLTAFSFHTMLPSLTPYLERHASNLRWAIIGGTTIAFMVYLAWEWMVLGIIPVQGPNSLIEALEVGQPITEFLRLHIDSRIVSIFAEYFALFALVTSFLGIALGLFDFLADGLKIPKKGYGKIVLGALLIIPIYIFAAYFERIFLVALDTSGGFGDTILNGIMPILMVWIGRYYLKFPNENRTPGGKPLLIVLFFFFIGALLLEAAIHAGWVCRIFDYCEIHLSKPI